MPAPDLDKLMQTASEPDREELELVCSGKTSAMAAYKARPGKETKADYDAARELYQETLERLWRAYFPEDAPAPEGERFKNRKQALDWLKAQGYKVSQGKFYNDCDAGNVEVHKDGTLSRYKVMQYGQQLDLERRSAPGKGADDLDELERRKLVAEVEKRERENEDHRREMDEKWLHADEAWASVAALVGTLQGALDHQCYTGAPALILACGGDPARAEEVSQSAKKLVATAFEEVLSAGEIEGIFSPDSEDYL